MRWHLLKPLRIVKGLVAAMHVAADVALDLLEKLNFVDGLGLVRVFAGLKRLQHFGVNFLLNDFQVLGRHAVDVLAHGDGRRLGGFWKRCGHLAGQRLGNRAHLLLTEFVEGDAEISLNGLLQPADQVAHIEFNRLKLGVALDLLGEYRLRQQAARSKVSAQLLLCLRP